MKWAADVAQGETGAVYAYCLKKLKAADVTSAVVGKSYGSSVSGVSEHL